MSFESRAVDDGALLSRMPNMPCEKKGGDCPCLQSCPAAIAGQPQHLRQIAKMLRFHAAIGQYLPQQAHA